MHSSLGDLTLGVAVAIAVFGAAWLLIPGGKSEIQSVLSDLRGALRKKARDASPVEAVAATS